jgi:hypothetical protein
MAGYGVHHQPQDEFTEEVLAKAKTARMYIEHLYKVQSQNTKERRDRWAGSWLTSPPSVNSHVE